MAAIYVPGPPIELVLAMSELSRRMEFGENVEEEAKTLVSLYIKDRELTADLLRAKASAFESEFVVTLGRLAIIGVVCFFLGLLISK